MKKEASKEDLEKEVVSEPYFGKAVAFALDHCGDVSGKKILDAGCGKGLYSVFFALKGAEVTGVDLNVSALDIAKKRALEYGVQDKCSFLHSSTESMSIDAASMDVIFSKSTIQYMRRDVALAEYKRILKKNGILILIENLPYNPFINLYRLRRKLFARTADKIRYVKSIRGYLNFHEIKDLEKDFHTVVHKEFHLFYMMAIHLSRYTNKSVAGVLSTVLGNTDKFIFHYFPFMKRFAWFTSIYCQNKRD
ncbi:MAG: class I SAM-dependent methyltransferase [Gammaproteobacteria bacterium]|nr:class I SAM-dependent methyltransferase [Gammaproteobacteria bacterium]